MIKSDSETVQDWIRLDDENVKRICDLVKSYDREIKDYLAEVVSSMCDIDTIGMMTRKDSIQHVHARWLFWYAYRYMTNDTYEHIAQTTQTDGVKFSTQCVIASVNKMSEMVINNTIWTKRWTVVKRIIKMRDQTIEFSFERDKKLPTDKIVVTIPKELQGKIQINFND